MRSEIEVLNILPTRRESSAVRYFQAVQAGFPSPAGDYLEEDIDLNTYLRPHPLATFIVRVSGDSMIDSNIIHGSLLIVDRSLKPSNNSIIVGIINGEFTVKHFIKTSNGICLMAANEKYKPCNLRGLYTMARPDIRPH
jgi:DNA polymerase V